VDMVRAEGRMKGENLRTDGKVYYNLKRYGGLTYVPQRPLDFKEFVLADEQFKVSRPSSRHA